MAKKKGAKTGKPFKVGGTPKGEKRAVEGGTKMLGKAPKGRKSMSGGKKGGGDCGAMC